MKNKGEKIALTVEVHVTVPMIEKIIEVLNKYVYEEDGGTKVTLSEILENKELLDFVSREYIGIDPKGYYYADMDYTLLQTTEDIIRGDGFSEWEKLRK